MDFFFGEGPQVFVEMTLSVLFCNLHALNKSSVGTGCFTAAASTLHFPPLEKGYFQLCRLAVFISTWQV